MFYLAQNEDHSLEDSISDSSRRSLKEEGKRPVYM